VIPKSFSATAMQTFIDCPAEYKAHVIDRAIQKSSSAASLGTACHLACEVWVKDGWYLKYPNGDWGTMKALWDEAYWSMFNDASRYDEGSKLVKAWMNRQDWSNRRVLSTEVKKSFPLKTSAGVIPFNYVMDRMDQRISDESIEVIDYKSIFQPVQPAELKNKLQARAYALAAQMEYPQCERIMVTFDLLRYDPIGIVFTKDENRATYRYILAVAEQIIASDGLTENICDSCRWCIRKTICATLNNHTMHGGTAALADPLVAAEHSLRIKNQIAGLYAAKDELEKVVVDYMQAQELLEFETGNLDVKVTVRGTRHIDPTVLGPIIGAELMAKYADIKVTEVDKMMSAENLTDEQKSRIRQSMTRVYGEPKVQVKSKSPFD
jgi:hypothetical protein